MTFFPSPRGVTPLRKVLSGHSAVLSGNCACVVSTVGLDGAAAEALRVPALRSGPVLGVAERALGRTLEQLELAPKRWLALGWESRDQVFEHRTLPPGDLDAGGAEVAD